MPLCASGAFEVQVRFDVTEFIHKGEPSPSPLWPDVDDLAMLSRSSLLILVLCLLSLPLTTQAQSAWFSGYSASTTSSTATLSWVTAVPATTQLHYGLTTSYGTHTALDTTLSTTHSTTLTGLASGSTYHLRFTARDAVALQITSLDYTFTTQTVAVTISISPTTGTVVSGGTSNSPRRLIMRATRW